MSSLNHALLNGANAETGPTRPSDVSADPAYRYSVRPSDVSADPAYRYSYMPGNDDDRRSLAASGRPTMRDIEVAHLDLVVGKLETARDFKGRRRMWPGVMLILVLIGAAGGLMAYSGLRAHSASVDRGRTYEKARFKSTTIADGTESGSDIVSDDGAIGNPKKYPASQCELPDYQSKNGHIIAVSANGTEVPIKIKGINWFGMET
jgi:endoglucanase